MINDCQKIRFFKSVLTFQYHATTAGFITIITETETSFSFPGIYPIQEEFCTTE